MFCAVRLSDDDNALVNVHPALGEVLAAPRARLTCPHHRFVSESAEDYLTTRQGRVGLRRWGAASEGDKQRNDRH